MDDFDRQVVCLAGLPFDLVDMAATVARVRAAAAERRRCFLSTPNLNFLIASQNDAAFRESVIHSDLSIADGMPLVWMAWLLGLPLRERVTGSGLFEALRHNSYIAHGNTPNGEPMKVYFFGGPEGAAAEASRLANADFSSGIRCVGFDCPGFGDVAQMSDAATIARINASGADFLVVALGARKGQAWIERNRGRLVVPVISHLGAVVNFVAGTVSRAPLWMQKSGLEWLWRIKEEPALWRRYWQDGVALARLLLTRVLPYAVWRRVTAVTATAAHKQPFAVAMLPDVTDSTAGAVRLVLRGAFPEAPDVNFLAALRSALRAAFAAVNQTAPAGKRIVLDFSAVTRLSPAGLGLLLMLRKRLAEIDGTMSLVGVSPALRRQFYWNGADYLLDGC